MRSLLCVGLLAACAGAPTSGTTAAPPDPAPAIRNAFADTSEQSRVGAFISAYRTRAGELQRSANYAAEIELLHELAAQFPGSAGVRSIAAQQIGTYLSFLGRHQEALQRFDEVDDAPVDTSDGRRILDHRVLDAVDAIVRVADTASAVFINEAHHVAQHRALTLELLPRLRALGFTHFAAETFAETDSALDRRGHAVQSSGFYTNEPLFGEVVRRASQLGYVLVPYEAVGGSTQEDRERGQAANLHRRVFAAQPDARVLVHAGYAHIDESGQLAGAAPMAVHFRRLTGIDPVTVDQTTMTERADTLREPAAYRRITTARMLERPVALRRADGTLWSARPGVHDITVVSPRTRYRQGRPHWLWSSGPRQPVPLARDVCGPAPRCQVSARLADESADAVPVDRLLVAADDPSPPLLLPPGEYRVTVRSVAGDTLDDRPLRVGSGPDGAAVQTRAVALTFDDLPAVARNRDDVQYWRRITGGILNALAAHGAPAIGFVNENKLERGGRLDTARVALLRQWLDAGLDLGNHTYSHPDLHRVSLDAFEADVLRGERITRSLLAERAREPRWFRHPFLHTGRSTAVRDSLEAFLDARGYRVAPVTVDNSDYIFAAAYDRALQDEGEAAAARVADAFLTYMDTVFGFYEAQARAIAGREIPHVLLLHANALNAATLDPLLARLRRRGYRFVPLDEAVRDDAYRMADTYAGPAGITWLHRWALTAQVDRRIFAGEPGVPDWVAQLAR